MFLWWRRNISSPSGGGWPSNGLLNNLVSGYLETSNDANDYVGSNNGTATNVTYSSSPKIGSYAGDFEASSPSYIDLPTLYGGFSEISVCAWIQVESTWNYKLFSATNSWNTSRIEFFIRNDIWSHFIDFWVRGAWSTSSARHQPWGAILSTGTWYHVVGTYENKTAKLYLNWSLVDTGSVISSNPSWLNDWDIWQGIVDSQQWDGLLNQVLVYSVALTADNVSDLYNSWSWLAYWSFTS